MPGSRPEPGAGYLGAVHGPEQLLRERDPSRLEALWSAADDVRRAHVGDEVHLRGLIEISNHCRRQCLYCGLRAGNRDLPRYRMTAGEVVECAVRARGYRCGTVVLQSGEDDGLAAGWVADVIRRIKDATGLAVTLSLGERSREDLAAWRRAGADRYLLRFETSDRGLYEKIHPERPGETRSRLAMLWVIRLLGYEVGSGVMVGIPGQSYGSLLSDLAYFGELDLDMIGIGPFIPHPETPLGKAEGGEDGVPADGLTALKMVALARLACPEANIPSTTALATLDPEEGEELGLRRGANVLMPNFTPRKYRSLYEIYPNKGCDGDPGGGSIEALVRRIEAIGRRVGSGPGGRRRGAEGTA